ncbi:Glucanosyltransferase-domain-containing protein [Fusarium flagelliforme]|uniref:1,3-beta-glucanosyltransferase n=1 Tax=Fusarium flagelliforme TaxID=2675880 RepID=A0A395M6J9_9HYPO|nr:Glucanosyltransferase-domain-containing protein [Fusarium flagelliforme]KAH7192078.1 Glucanosyltransferase-domain-containing protein [Fusarium flagelliforme]RFN43490.1 1,3-beta-glucanosyltransferase gel2 [Fusarium flagelliforme]
MLIKAALLALGAAVVNAVPPLEVQGTDFVNPDTGNKFQIVGMAYQPGGSAGYDPSTGKDPLSHAETCMRDAALMQILGINAIRVYNLDPNVNHDECASIFNAAGMYMMIDVNSPLPHESLHSLAPWESYHVDYLNRTFAILEAFGNYPNTLLFFAANEVINDEATAQDAPQYIRALTRDLKNYVKNNLKRKIPIGYSAADVREVLFDTWNYLQCTDSDDEDDMSRADLFALNSYSWCGAEATFESSSYNDLVTGFESSSIPIFFSEYGCIEPKPRYWNETQAIYGSKMNTVFSGGVVYEYTEEENNYGLVKIDDDKLSVLGDFNRLKNQFARIKWESVQSKAASNSSSNKAPECKTSLIKDSNFDSNFTIPDVPPGAQKLIDNGIKNKPSGKIVKISDWNVKLDVNNADGTAMKNLKVVPLKDDESNASGNNDADTGSETTDDKNSTDSGNSSSGNSGDAKGSDDDEDAAILNRPLTWAMAFPLAVMMFAL